MEHSRSRIILDGAVAGLLGAGVVALWFLIFDAARGHIFETPVLLAAAILHGSHPDGISAVQLMVEYSVLHFAAFIITGIIGANLLETAEHEPTLLVSLLVFLGAFEVFFLGVVMFLGPAAMHEITWWGIVVANLSAGAVMLYYFLARHPALARNLLGSWIPLLQEGVTAGLIGAVIVAAWFFAYDLAMGEAFKTPLLLGEAIFNNAAAATPDTVAPLIVAYTVLHFIGFVAFGIALAILMTATDREPLVALGVLVVFAIFEVFFFGWVTLINATLLDQLGWWKIVFANGLALIGMMTYEMRAHRGLWVRLQERWALLEHEGDESIAPTPTRRR
ncbi:MAG TPA: hypothetical protein VMT64_04045 [Candidatus Binataceae bacterium]|nr:hypothetical protein [Candidatus Binataceae bacterium]